MDANDTRQWFDQYLAAFTACGRGERDTRALLAYYGVPMLIATDDGFVALMTEEQVISAVQPQIDGLRAAGYSHTELVSSDITMLNATAALYRGEFSRRRADQHEIGRLTITYLLTSQSSGVRISALLPHGR